MLSISPVWTIGASLPHTMLIVPLDRMSVLLSREMERVSIENMVRNAEFRDRADSETVADVAAETLAGLALTARRLGLEAWSAGLSHGIACALRNRVDAAWSDVTGMVDDLRLVKSPEEQALLRKAAAAADAGTAAAVAAVSDGAEEREIAAACLAAMTRAGGELPVFETFIRPRTRLGEEHTTWGQGEFRRGETVFLEIAGFVARYNDPNGRPVHLGPAPEQDRAVAEIARGAYQAALAALKPGAKARDIHTAWQDEVDAAGLAHHRRHHCGYAVGISFPPAWTGGKTVTGLRPDSDLPIREGMSFHLMSWLMGCGGGDLFVSSCVLLTGSGAESLTTRPHFNEVCSPQCHVIA